MFFVAPLLRHGTDEQRTRLLPKIADGSHIGAFAMTEAETGSSALELRCRGQRGGDGYRLDGEKVFVTNGPIADMALVIARTLLPRIQCGRLARGGPVWVSGRRLERRPCWPT